MTADQVVTRGPVKEPHYGYDPVSIAERRAGWESSLATGRAKQPEQTRSTGVKPES